MPNGHGMPEFTDPAFTVQPMFVADDVTMVFMPTTKRAGFSHRVLIVDNRRQRVVCRRWLPAGMEPTAESAAALYWADSHLTPQTGGDGG